ncbi:MAG: hypothetical protein A2Z97_07205 [Bdellovibrionales bacterium GWB1_52_6]|nr:MAG: hypothetical protein A2Z97_07205 [Bdellovibrionales bacterium GWB1_52_6]OFZ04287.1 MAG: hypothetical protein A2X97_06470 [Bdellovibrionales bacterium GWA1_52_35]HCM40865.1 hypothetical protein [Bdellovibrionales bacterium]
MAEDDEDKIRRRREREDEIEQEDLAKKKKMGVESVRPPAEQTEDYLNRIDPLIDQVDSLYGQYIHGLEKHPPLERRKMLDQLINTVSMMPKVGSNLQFRYNTIHARYISQRDKWEKWMRDLESGKLKRAIPTRR